MSTEFVDHALSIFRSRLKMLAGLLGVAEKQWSEGGRDVAELVAARLAPDMFPLPHQIVFACSQAGQFAAWCRGGTYDAADGEGMDWEGMKALVAATIAELDAPSERIVVAPDTVKRIGLGRANAHLDLPGRRYVDDWLFPNFYFHLTTAYDLLRMKGVMIGKANFLAHLAGDIRPDTP